MYKPSKRYLNKLANIIFDENKIKQRKARDNDIAAGLVGGALGGLLLGDYISNLSLKKDAPLSQILARKVLFGGGLAIAGSLAGKKLAEKMYDDRVTDRILDDVQDYIEDRRVERFIDDLNDL